MRSSAQRQQQNADHRSTVEVLRDARRDTSRTVDIAEETSHGLAKQGEQIDRMSRKVDKIEEELTVSDKILKTMTGFTGMVTSLFSSTKKADAKRPEAAAPAASDTQPARRPELPDRRPRRHEQSAPPPTTVTAEEDELLDGISADLHAVRELAQHQNAAIRQQNQRLDELTDKTQRVNGHMERTRGRIQRIS